MDNIEVKLKEETPIDEVLLKRKDFNKSFKRYELIKKSYAKLAAFWGASIGIAVFIGLGSLELINKSKQTSDPVLKESVNLPVLEQQQETVQEDTPHDDNEELSVKSTHSNKKTQELKDIPVLQSDVQKEEKTHNKKAADQQKSATIEPPSSETNHKKIQIDYELED